MQQRRGRCNVAQLSSNSKRERSERAPRRVRGQLNSNFNVYPSSLFTTLSSALSMLLTLFPRIV